MNNKHDMCLTQNFRNYKINLNIKIDLTFSQSTDSQIPQTNYVNVGYNLKRSFGKYS